MKTYKEDISGCANSSLNFAGQVPEHLIGMITPENINGDSDAIEDLKKIGKGPITESLIKLTKDLNIDKFCFD